MVQDSSFMNYNAHEMLATVRYAEQIYYDKKRDWNKIVERAMNKDFSWKNSAKQYERIIRRNVKTELKENDRKKYENQVIY